MHSEQKLHFISHTAATLRVQHVPPTGKQAKRGRISSNLSARSVFALAVEVEGLEKGSDRISLTVVPAHHFTSNKSFILSDVHVGVTKWVTQR